MHQSTFVLTRVYSHQSYTGYQRNKQCSQKDKHIELYDEDLSVKKKGLLYNAVSVCSLKRLDKCLSQEIKLEKEKREITGEKRNSPDKIKLFKESEKIDSPVFCANLPFLSPQREVTQSNLYTLPGVQPKNKVTLEKEKNQLLCSTTELQPSPFASTAFGEKCTRNFITMNTTRDAISSAMNWGKSGTSHKNKAKSSEKGTPHDQNVSQKRLNDFIVKEILTQFRLYKDEERIIPIHLTKISENLCDETMEFLAKKGGLLKFIKDRPKFFRIKQVAKSGGWYVTASIDVCERFAGNFHRNSQRSVYGGSSDTPKSAEIDKKN